MPLAEPAAEPLLAVASLAELGDVVEPYVPALEPDASVAPVLALPLDDCSQAPPAAVLPVLADWLA